MSLVEIPSNDRHYKPIWDRIKTRGACTVVTSAELFSRIKKAVSKEKLRDFEWLRTNRKTLVFETGKTKDGRDKLSIKLKPNFSVRNIL